jgi:hypothetical protein
VFDENQTVEDPTDTDENESDSDPSSGTDLSDSEKSESGHKRQIETPKNTSKNPPKIRSHGPSDSESDDENHIENRTIYFPPRDTSEANHQHLRRSSRKSVPPQRYTDVPNPRRIIEPDNRIIHPRSNYKFESIHEEQPSFENVAHIYNNPRTYKEAVPVQHHKEWEDAMNKEYESLLQNQTCSGPMNDVQPLQLAGYSRPKEVLTDRSINTRLDSLHGVSINSRELIATKRSPKYLESQME